MKLKYYMRGLGIGIILTTLIFSFGSTKEKLTDKEIVTRAKALGMVTKEENNTNLDEVLSELDATGTPTPGVTVVPAKEPTNVPTAIPTTVPTVKPTEVPTTEPSKAPVPTTASVSKDDKPSNNISFTIKGGMASQQVAELLEEKGIIKDAKEFNYYIVGVGKASVIRVGEFSLPKDASYEEIVDAITDK